MNIRALKWQLTNYFVTQMNGRNREGSYYFNMTMVILQLEIQEHLQKSSGLSIENTAQGLKNSQSG